MKRLGSVQEDLENLFPVINDVGGALFSDKSEIPYMYGDGSKPIIPILLE